MALAVATENAIDNEFELHVFELAYIFSILRVTSVAALPDKILFPSDPKVRKKMLAEGEKRLISSGRIVPSETSGTADYNDDLLSMAAAVADPSFSILTRKQSADGQRSDVSIFFSPVEVVEVAHTDRQAFRFRRLNNPSSAFHQVRKMLGVSPSGRDEQAELDLRIEAFEQVRKHAAAGELQEAGAILCEEGLEAPCAQEFVEALAAPQRKGIVSVLKHAAQTVTDVRVLGYYAINGAGWLTTVVDEAARKVRIEEVDSERFVERLVERVAGVCV